MSEQLLPCPFCGGAAQVVGDRDVGFCVVSDCGAALGEEYDNAAYPNHDFITEADAIEAWNRRRATSTPAAAPDALREALSWALDMIDMYDERLAGIDGRERVYSTVHRAGKAKARAALATAPAAEPPAPVMTVEKLRAHIEDVLHEWAKTALWYERIVTEDGVAPKAIREKRNAIYESAIECCIDRLVALSSAGDNTKRTGDVNERGGAEAKTLEESTPAAGPSGAAAPTPEAPHIMKCIRCGVAFRCDV